MYKCGVCVVWQVCVVHAQYHTHIHHMTHTTHRHVPHTYSILVFTYVCLVLVCVSVVWCVCGVCVRAYVCVCVCESIGSLFPRVSVNRAVLALTVSIRQTSLFLHARANPPRLLLVFKSMHYLQLRNWVMSIKEKRSEGKQWLLRKIN